MRKTMAGTSPKRTYASRTSPGQTKARRILIAKAIAEKKSATETARIIGITEWSLRQWVIRNMPEAKGKFADTRGRPKLSDAQREKRLRLVVAHSQAEAARRLGISAPALCGWLKDNAPEGAAKALLDYVSDVR